MSIFALKSLDREFQYQKLQLLRGAREIPGVEYVQRKPLGGSRI
jgi:hypothetical protein